jgi:Flp pilus assembly protein TadG
MALSMSKRIRSHRRRGATAVEFAFCAPVLFVVVMAIIEFSRIYQLQQTSRQAAYETARAAIAPGATAAEAKKQGEQLLRAIGVKDGVVELEPATITPSTMSVTATVKVTPLSNSWFLKFFATGRPFVASATLDHENASLPDPSF